MSRTYRDFAWWVKWSDDYHLTLMRGQGQGGDCKRARRNGNLGWDDVWGRKGKRWHKRFHSKAVRRCGKVEINAAIVQLEEH